MYVSTNDHLLSTAVLIKINRTMETGLRFKTRRHVRYFGFYSVAHIILTETDVCIDRRSFVFNSSLNIYFLNRTLEAGFYTNPVCHHRQNSAGIIQMLLFYNLVA